MDSETNDGVGQHAQREYLGNEGQSLLLGRTGVRVEREARGSTNREADTQDRSRTRDGRGRPSRAESYHSATSAQNQELIMDLQRQVRELQQDRDMRGPPPHMPFAPAAMETPGVPCASGPVRAPLV